MNDAGLHTNWDTLLVAIPFLIVLAVGFFHLDEVLATPKSRLAQQRRPVRGIDENGMQILCDPDGRRWKPRAKVPR